MTAGYLPYCVCVCWHVCVPSHIALNMTLSRRDISFLGVSCVQQIRQVVASEQEKTNEIHTQLLALNDCVHTQTNHYCTCAHPGMFIVFQSALIRHWPQTRASIRKRKKNSCHIYVYVSSKWLIDGWILQKQSAASNSWVIIRILIRQMY